MEIKYAYFICSSRPIEEVMTFCVSEGSYACECLANPTVIVPEEYVLEKFRSFKTKNFIFPDRNLDN